MKIAFVISNSISDAIRMIPIGEELAKRPDIDVTMISIDRDLSGLADFDVIVMNRPGPLNLELMERYKGKRFVVDVDDDFACIPEHNPAYPFVGPGNPAALEAWQACIRRADVVTVSSQALAERYAGRLVPNGWSKDNPLWTKPALRRETVNIGWAGTTTHMQDVRLAIPGVTRVLHICRQARIVIGGDPEVYLRFKSIPELQKMFVRDLPYYDYPQMLRYYDILIAPLEDNEFNRAKSDIKLVDAGVRGIPFVASPLPEYQAWSQGPRPGDYSGFLASDDEQWAAELAFLIDRPEARRIMGTYGREQAAGREIGELAKIWLEILERL